MATPFSSTTSLRSVFRPKQIPPPKALLSIRDYNAGLNCIKCGSTTTPLSSWKSASNYIRIRRHALMLPTQPFQSGNLSKYRRGVIRAATIEEIEAEKALIEKDVRARMEKTIDTVRSSFNSIRTGRANPAMLDKIEVEYYGSPVGLKSIAQISTPDASSLLIQPYDKSSLKSIEKAIVNSNLGMTPNNDGEVIRLTLPQLTSERRKELSKVVAKQAEEGKVAVRNIRRDALKAYDKLEKEKKLSEDNVKDLSSDLQKLTDDYMKKIDVIYKQKEKWLSEHEFANCISGVVEGVSRRSKWWRCSPADLCQMCNYSTPRGKKGEYA
ncbi:ribosome-recycling factor, chloroplastic isoform X3 [Cucurbita moschata]|uniref:Ribosome-recycling factor, chloroplastic n=1 Tax=Cucurbita moschata TaxID=3662 RepID=A0A6J1ESQ7_CUCMO|nr:ribosome-recycling factor, chloroplastic isoform X3 [Cucurbita moschata]